MKIVIKVGTQSILSNHGMPIESIFSSLVEQIIQLRASGHQVVLVSSGAVGFGRSVANQILGKEYGFSIGEKQVLASLGQHELMQLYSNMFKKHNILASQLLLTKQDFCTRQHYLNISRLINEILSQKNIIPIVNENDSVAIEELMFTDNDELAGLIATQINADRLIILSNVEGVYASHPNSANAELIYIIHPEKVRPNISSIKNTHGRGGMISKLNTAYKISNLGIMTHIASISQQSVIIRLIINNEQIGTTVLPSKKRKSNIKRWISYNSEKKSGKIIINDFLYEILRENKRVISILPVGIDQCVGDFQKGDIIEILAPDNKIIGIGLARYDSGRLEKLLRQQNKPVFIHYDYLYIF
ncbi:glutamate 5-kinase [Wolbachia endosymbiont of Chironomus riparius]|uniref:glutamate 5-kinase n=1 Tax=Wolbachia endosymbiont of Chironomus riparius TaxID=2883238 RepID=UPI00209E7A61|nr:glutamate 5-kinase [Wolbachia endosymbiont of Chironomus riparius]